MDMLAAPIAFGDLQGCLAPFRRLLAKLSPPGDTPLWFAGDLINRGPDSLATLREIAGFGARAKVVLGNHDMHLLAVSAGIRRQKADDTFGDILTSPDADELVDWLRHRPFAHLENGTLMVHAGVLPQWDTTLVLELADELGRALRAPNWRETLAALYEKGPNRWSPDLPHIDRLRIAFTAFTRVRFCTPDGEMEFSANGTVENAPAGFVPWFEAPDRRTSDTTIVFGHWAALGLFMRDNLIGLDSGCVWGNRLTAVRLARDPAARTVAQEECTDCRNNR